MQLTQFSDFSLRMLLYLAAYTDRPVSIAEISRAYGISYHHLVKVGSLLVQKKLVSAQRGRNGGLSLAQPASAIRIGDVVQATEPNFHLVECFDPEHDTCPITPVCGLKRALYEARRDFLATLNRYTLGDVIAKKEPLVRLWTLRLATPGPGPAGGLPRTASPNLSPGLSQDLAPDFAPDLKAPESDEPS